MASLHLKKNDGYFGSFWRYPMLVFTFFTPTPAEKRTPLRLGTSRWSLHWRNHIASFPNLQGPSRLWRCVGWRRWWALLLLDVPIAKPQNQLFRCFFFEKEEKETLHRVLRTSSFSFFLRVTLEFWGGFQGFSFLEVLFGLGDGFTSPKILRFRCLILRYCDLWHHDALSTKKIGDESQGDWKVRNKRHNNKSSWWARLNLPEI